MATATIKPNGTAGPFGPQGSGATQIHAAAVNGEKSALAKLIIANTKDLDSGDKFGRTPLMYCVLGDRLECAEVLLKAGTTVNKKDVGGRTALHWAAHKGNLKFLKLLLSKGAIWLEKDNEGQTAMHLSTRHKSPKCLALLMKQLEPGEIDGQDNNKRTALHWSASYGHLEHVKMLIKQDSNIGIPDVEGKTPLHWAASSRNQTAVDCVKLILETTPSVINWQDYEGRTALHLAVADGNEDIVRVLTSLEKCNVSALDNMFRTPLHWAAVLGHSKIVGMLLDRKADYASSDSNGATPLHYAAQNNYSETVEVFLGRKHITDEADVEGRTAFMWAASKGADGVIRVFLQHKVDLHQTDKNGGTVLHSAALAGHASTVKLLLDSGCHRDGVDLLRHTPLFRSCEMGHMDVVQTLMDYGAKVDVVDQDGRSPLHWAALGGHAYICQMLIKFGIDPNVRDHSGRSPLQCAAYGGFVNCMSVLIEHKADPNAQDSEGMTALHWACSKGHLDAVKLLIEYSAFPNHMEFTEDRYTPLDYALMGEHHEVAQYMLEQGALSITGIQDIAACKIQASFRGFRVRKTFQERKKLLMKHEQLRKDAAKKRAEEEYKKKEDVRFKRDVEERRRLDLDGTNEGLRDEVPSPRPHKKSKVREEPSEEELMLQKQRETQQMVQTERIRLADHRRKQWAARRIQRAWRGYVFKTRGLLKTVAESIHEKRLRAGEEEWQKQIAALTIQLAWRKYYRRKLLKNLTPHRRKLLHMWDPAVIAAKQQVLMRKIYGEHIAAADWHPRLRPLARPLWLKHVPSPAAVSYNFAVGQYHPGTCGGALGQQQGDANLSDDFGALKLSENFQSHHFSYNMYDS